ncbi:hypothetical protein SAMN04487910_2052 [Aquimarina amphilecti]|uniref:Uncharacterized protein n=1 Tax=Aquimarina amphilecti TaxID=1038014 RepID=A0A1H7NEW1_AQUAM|nr:hypothetical protein [Aquimarina amphilecti]SEL21829.1 hypothetical protein SAMN04487910_2052 [Aquimarina amphilecti]
MSAISGMNISMKNNNRRGKRKAFSNISGESDTESKGIKVEQVSEELLIKIRKKIKQQQKATKKRNIVIAIISLLLVTLVFWAIILHFQNDPGVSFGPFR